MEKGTGALNRSIHHCLLLAFMVLILPELAKPEPLAVETSSIRFGNILGMTGSTCAMDPSGSLSGGACLDGMGTAGSITISGPTGTPFSLELIPPLTAVNHLTFTPLLVGGGSLGNYSLDASGSLSVPVGGTLETDAAMPPAPGPTDLIYTVRINF